MNYRKYGFHVFMESLHNDIRESYSKIYGKIMFCIYPYFVRIREKTVQKNSSFTVLLCSVIIITDIIFFIFTFFKGYAWLKSFKFSFLLIYYLLIPQYAWKTWIWMVIHNNEYSLHVYSYSQSRYVHNRFLAYIYLVCT